MNRKVIKAISHGKLTKWMKSIKDEKVRALVEKNTILTGGAIANMLLNEDVKDFDLYFKNKETALAVAHYYVNQFNENNKDKKNKLGGNAKAYVLDGEWVTEGGFNSLAPKELVEEFSNQGKTKSRMIAGTTPDRVKIIVRSDGVAADKDYEDILKEPFDDAVEAIQNYDAVIATADEIDAGALEQSGSLAVEKESFRPVFLSTNAITLSDKIQIVIRFYGEADQIHENYDFVHCTNYYDYATKELVLKAEALEALMNKELKYVGSKYPLCSVIRTRKFIKRGFHINAGQYLKMLFQISQLDLTNVDVLEDQLVGVDSAYFMILIEALRNKQTEDSNFTVNEGYVASIIDKIF